MSIGLTNPKISIKLYSKSKRFDDEDDQILVCHKPAGVPVQTKKIGTQDMESILKNYLFIHSSHHAGHKPPYLAVIHRLDQPVSGILVFARTPAAAKNLNQQLQNDQFEKYYQAVVCGALPDSGTLTDYLVKDGRTNTSRICSKNTPGAKKAVLSYEILETSNSIRFPVVGWQKESRKARSAIGKYPLLFTNSGLYLLSPQSGAPAPAIWTRIW